MSAKVARYNRMQRLRVDPTLAPHGHTSTYGNWVCRCEPCREANAAACRKRRERRKQRKHTT